MVVAGRNLYLSSGLMTTNSEFGMEVYLKYIYKFCMKYYL
jgi:hypothetical protein